MEVDETRKKKTWKIKDTSSEWEKRNLENEKKA